MGIIAKKGVKMAQKFFVNNRWWDSSKTKKVINPYNNQVINEVFLLEEKQINLVVDSNVQAFEITKHLPAHKRPESMPPATNGTDVLEGPRPGFVVVLFHP